MCNYSSMIFSKYIIVGAKDCISKIPPASSYRIVIISMMIITITIFVRIVYYDPQNDHVSEVCPS